MSTNTFIIIFEISMYSILKRDIFVQNETLFDNIFKIRTFIAVFLFITPVKVLLSGVCKSSMLPVNSICRKTERPLNKKRN